MQLWCWRLHLRTLFLLWFWISIKNAFQPYIMLLNLARKKIVLLRAWKTKNTIIVRGLHFQTLFLLWLWIGIKNAIQWYIACHSVVKFFTFLLYNWVIEAERGISRKLPRAILSPYPSITSIPPRKPQLPHLLDRWCIFPA